MEREIKFRGKSVDTGSWVYGYIIKFLDQICYILRIDKIDDSFDKIEVYLDSVSQYIGLKDKSGTEIYEGDILKMYNENDKVIIEFRGGQFVGKNIDKKHPIQETQNRNWLCWEVVGNIYENPELITK